MLLMPYNVEFSMLILSDDVTRPGLERDILRYYVEVLEAHPYYELQQIRARRALEDAERTSN